VDRRVIDDESGGWLVMERNVLVEEVLCKRWIGDDESSGGEKSVGGRSVV
jgi:hypothetical protein